VWAGKGGGEGGEGEGEGEGEGSEFGGEALRSTLKKAGLVMQ
jgi:hypothetical protein